MFSEGHCYYNRHITGPRTSPIPEYSKDLKAVHNKRVFNHELSVFKGWKKYSNVDIHRALVHDFHHWKVPRFVKDDAEVRLIEGTIKANWEYLN